MRTRILPLLVAIVALGLAACDKPTEADCKKAIENLDRIHDVTTEPAKTAAAVRKCQASATKSSVQCMINAKTKEQADACK
jgi:hypothetical protein